MQSNNNMRIAMDQKIIVEKSNQDVFYDAFDTDASSIITDSYGEVLVDGDSFENVEEEQWTIKPKKMSKKMEATEKMCEDATERFLEVQNILFVPFRFAVCISPV